MANVNVTSDAWTEISITSGTVQNISATADIELSAEQTDNSGVVLKPSELYQWDNETIYARAVTEETGALRVVNFKRATGGGSSVAYSTTEQQIGTWVDGKPLYQKTYEITSPSTAGAAASVILLDTSVDVVSMDGHLLPMMPINFTFDSTNYVATWQNSGDDDIYMQVSSHYVNNSGYITLQYTKASE